MWIKKTKDILITADDQSVLYAGSAESIPFLQQKMVEITIMQFDDPDPCPIHLSYAYRYLKEALFQELEAAPEQILLWEQASLFVREMLPPFASVALKGK